MRRAHILGFCFLAMLCGNALAHEQPPSEVLPETAQLTFSFHGRTVTVLTADSNFEINSRTSHQNEEVQRGFTTIHEQAAFQLQGSIHYAEQSERYIVRCTGVLSVTSTSEENSSESEHTGNNESFELEFDASTFITPGESRILAGQEGGELMLRLELPDHD